MGLASYGEPKNAQAILDNLIDLKPDGSFRLDLDYFEYCTGLIMTNDRFHDLFGGPLSPPEGRVTQREMDLAASVQAVHEEAVLRLTRSLVRDTGLRNLCLAGGVALNCVANGKILRDGHVDNIWVQPAAGDAGGALGVALAAYYQFADQPRRINGGDAMKGSYLGPEFSQGEIEGRLSAAGARFTTLDDPGLIDACATAIEDGLALGWFQGCMEFGPRALGARSILGDARSQIPAVTHVDNSACIQTDHAHSNPRFHALILHFKQRTGCPVIVNTSFNVRGEPIVATPEDAFRCFMGTGLDALAIGNCLLIKLDQDPAQDYKNSFELD